MLYSILGSFGQFPLDEREIGPGSGLTFQPFQQNCLHMGDQDFLPFAGQLRVFEPMENLPGSFRSKEVPVIL